MSVQAVLAPVFVQVFLVFVLLGVMSWTRMAAINSGQVRLRDVAVGERAWPTRATQAADSYGNQFEMPVLFFAIVPLVLLTHKADLAFVVLEWLFVVCRIAQAAIHTTSNNLKLRGPAFLASALMVAAAWALFAIDILLR